MEILNEYGLADTTMRRVAATLGVAPGALYWHVANKQALIAALAQRIIETVSGSTPLELALSLRTHLLAHRDGAEVTAAALAQPDNASWAALLLKLEESLLDEVPMTSKEDRTIAAAAMAHLVLGSTTMEQARQLHHAVDATIQTDNRIEPGLITSPTAESSLSTAVGIILDGLRQQN